MSVPMIATSKYVNALSKAWRDQLVSYEAYGRSTRLLGRLMATMAGLIAGFAGGAYTYSKDAPNLVILAVGFMAFLAVWMFMWLGYKDISLFGPSVKSKENELRNLTHNAALKFRTDEVLITYPKALRGRSMWKISHDLRSVSRRYREVVFTFNVANNLYSVHSDAVALPLETTSTDICRLFTQIRDHLDEIDRGNGCMETPAPVGAGGRGGGTGGGKTSSDPG